MCIRGDLCSVQAADGVIATQAEADTLINQPLAVGDVTYDKQGDIPYTSNLTDYKVQIAPTEDITIDGGAAKNALTLKLTKSTKNTSSISLSDPNHSNITFKNLKELKIEAKDDPNYTPDNDPETRPLRYPNAIFAQGSGVFTVEDSVGKFTVDSNTDRYLLNASSNIYSPEVYLKEGSTNIPDPSITQIFGNRVINLGDDDHRLKKVTFEHEYANALSGTAARIHDKSILRMNTDTLNVNHWNTGFLVNSREGTDKNGVILGSEEQPVTNINMEDIANGYVSIAGGTVTVYAERNHIHLAEGYTNLAYMTDNSRFASGSERVKSAGLNNTGNGKFNLHFGTGKNSSDPQLDNGLIITGLGNSIGIANHAQNFEKGETPTLNIYSGDILVKDNLYGIHNEVLNSDATSKAIVNIKAHDLTITNSKNAAIYSSTDAYTNLHASHKAQIEGTISTLSAVTNLNNTFNFSDPKAPSNDGTTILTGRVENEVWSQFSPAILILNRNADYVKKIATRMLAIPESITHIGFNTADSIFRGSVKDKSLAAKTTIDVTNKATWYVNKYSAFSSEIASKFYNLRLRDGGTVVLGSEDPNFDVVGGNTRNGKSSYNQVRVEKLNENTADFKDHGGVLEFRTHLAENEKNKQAHGYSDTLFINQESYGKHKIRVNDASFRLDGIKPTKGWALLVIDKSNNPEATFEGAADLNTGGFFAKKAIITSDAPPADYATLPTTLAGTRNWYLTLTDEPVPDIPAPGTDPSVPDQNPPIPPITPNGEAHISLLNHRYLLPFLEQDTLRKRLGELREDTTEKGLWARYRRGGFRYGTRAMDGQFTMYQLGYDKLKKEEHPEDTHKKRYYGGAYHYVTSEAQHTRSDLSLRGHILTGYMTDVYDDGRYLDLVGKFGWARGGLTFFDDNFPDTAHWSSHFYSLSGEYGRRKIDEKHRYIEPQVQLTWSHLGRGKYHSTNHIDGQLSAFNSLIFRTGILFGKKDEQNHYYAKAFWNHEFLGLYNGEYFDGLDRFTTRTKAKASWWTLGLGVQKQLDSNKYLYFDIQRDYGGFINKSWELELGLRCMFN